MRDFCFILLFLAVSPFIVFGQTSINLEKIRKDVHRFDKYLTERRFEEDLANGRLTGVEIENPLKEPSLPSKKAQDAFDNIKPGETMTINGIATEDGEELGSMVVIKNYDGTISIKEGGGSVGRFSNIDQAVEYYFGPVEKWVFRGVTVAIIVHATKSAGYYLWRFLRPIQTLPLSTEPIDVPFRVIDTTPKTLPAPSVVAKATESGKVLGLLRGLGRFIEPITLLLMVRESYKINKKFIEEDAPLIEKQEVLMKEFYKAKSEGDLEKIEAVRGNLEELNPRIKELRPKWLYGN